jgi:hypothetical protein
MRAPHQDDRVKRTNKIDQFHKGFAFLPYCIIFVRF